MTSGVYCVTDFASSDDLSPAFEAIFDDLDARGLAGAAIVVPPGGFRLSAPVDIRHDFLTIRGQNAGFQTGTGFGGGSRIAVEGAVGFRVPRDPGGPRIRSLTLSDLLLDGGAAADGRTGIEIAQDSDNVVVEGMAIKEFGTGLLMGATDAAHIRNNMILENTACVRLLQGIASIVSGNRMGGKPGGITLFVEGFDRLVISHNNLFPDGYANLVMKECRFCTVTGNQLQSYYAGLLHLEGACEDIVVTGNHLLAQAAPSGRWNDLDGDRPASFGLVRLEGSGHLFSGNTVTSRITDEHAQIVIAGSSCQVGPTLLRAQGPVDPVVVTGGSGATANVVVDTVDEYGLVTADGVEVRFRALPDLR